MNYLTQKQFPRRAFLRGVGATVALPFLDAMVPAGRSRAVAAATEKTRQPNAQYRPANIARK